MKFLLLFWAFIQKLWTIFLSFLICMLLFSCVTPSNIQELNELESPQEYFAMYVNGKRVGYSTKSRTYRPDQVVTATYDYSEYYSYGTKTEDTIKTTHIERSNGEPVKFEYIENETKKTWFNHKNETIKIDGSKKQGEGFKIIVTKKGKPHEDIVKNSEGLLLDNGLDLAIKKTGLREGSKFASKTIDSYDPVDIANGEGRIGQIRDVTLIDHTLPLTEIIIQWDSERYGIISEKRYVDKNFQTKKIVQQTESITFELVSCSREFAMKKIEKKDFVDEYIIKCPVLIAQNAKQVTYHIVLPHENKLEIPISDNQSVRKAPDGSLFVTIHPAKAIGGNFFPYRGNDQKVLEALRPTDLIQCNNKLIIELAQKAVNEEKDVAKAVKKIEAFVHKYLKSSNFYGELSAIEVADKREGDCTEYAVLTAALCRAIGIPARVVYGYKYETFANFKWNCFWPHAWNEVYIGDKWIGLDATRAGILVVGDSFTASHIAISGIGGEADAIDAINFIGFSIIDVTQ